MSKVEQLPAGSAARRLLKATGAVTAEKAAIAPRAPVTILMLRVCVLCGCDDLHACVTDHGPCFWPHPDVDVCSACVMERELAP